MSIYVNLSPTHFNRGKLKLNQKIKINCENCVQVIRKEKREKESEWRRYDDADAYKVR